MEGTTAARGRRSGSSQSGTPRPVILAPWNGGLAVARALARRGMPVVVMASEGDSYASRIRGVDGEVLPSLPEGREVWLERLAAMGDCAVVTGTDVASEFLAAARATLPESVRTFEGTGQVHGALMNKWAAYEIADRAGVRRPWSHSASTPAELESAVKAASYPCVLKPVLSHLWRRQFGDDRVLLMRTPAELEARGSRALATGLEFVVSDYVPGGDDAVEEAILVRAEDGSYPVAFGCRKLRQHPTGFGAASLCVSAPIPQSMELARRLLDEAGYVGVAGIETKRHAVSGDYYFLEANVRIPTQWGLGDAAGADASWRLYATLAGLELGAQAPPRHGVKLVFPQLELHAAYRTLRGGPGPGLLRRLAGWRGAKDLGVFDPRDPGPGLALARDVIARRVAQLPGRRRRR